MYTPLNHKIDWTFGFLALGNGILAVALPDMRWWTQAAAFFCGTSLIFFMWSLWDWQQSRHD